jgi:hypothetical protein
MVLGSSELTLSSYNLENLGIIPTLKNVTTVNTRIYTWFNNY